MRLQGMAQALQTQEQDSAARELSFLERLALLVDQQWTWRKNQALQRRLKRAKLVRHACIEDIDYRTPRGLDKGVLRSLAEEIGLGGPARKHLRRRPHRRRQELPGPGAHPKACRDGYSAFYTRAATLFRDLALARADCSFPHLLVRLSRIDVLAIDDWAMAPLNESERRDFWEICEDRYECRSLVLTSQLPVSRWREQIGDPTVADGILDRIVHNAHRIELCGESMRKARSQKPER